MWTCLEIVLWGWFQSSFLRLPAVQFSSVRIPKCKSTAVAWSSRNCQASTKSAQVNKSDQNQMGPQEKFSAVLFSRKWGSVKTQDLWSTARLAMEATHHCLLSPTYTLVTHHVSFHGSCLSKIPCESASARHCMSMHHITQPETSTSAHHHASCHDNNVPSLWTVS